METDAGSRVYTAEDRAAFFAHADEPLGESTCVQRPISGDFGSEPRMPNNQKPKPAEYRGQARAVLTL